jgi:hypothetical protein
MNLSVSRITVAMLVFGAIGNAAPRFFGEPPFTSNPGVIGQPGRQVVGGERFLEFDISNDVYVLDPAAFGVTDLQFVNDLAANLPAADVNFVVLQTTDNDNDPVTPFGAGNAATLIANAIDEPGAGFFIYFNSGLNLPRLVFSTDLSSADADLQIVARMTNLVGQQAALPTFTEANVSLTAVPEPSSLLLLSSAGILLAGYAARRRRARS